MSTNTGGRKCSIVSLLQSAVDLRVLCERDKAQLVSAGLAWSWYDELLRQTGKAQRYHIQVGLSRQDRKCATADLRAYATTCTALRTALRQALNTAMERIGGQAGIPGMGQRKAYIDISQDLLELAVSAEAFMTKHPGSMPDSKLISKARAHSAELFRRASRRDILHTPDPRIRQKYAKALQDLARVIRQIKAIGKYAFRDDPSRKKAYRVGN